MKGIILAAGKGTRLGAITGGIGVNGVGVSKPLVPTNDKPTIYYPLADIISAGISEILIIAAPNNVDQFKSMLGDGSELGITLKYDVQPIPRGTADAFLIAEKFIGNDDVALMFGDNIFNSDSFASAMKQSTAPRGATVFALPVDNPSDFGVVEFDADGRVISLEEKPAEPKSSYAVPGAYFYTNKVVEIAKELKPSPRGELEITDLNLAFLAQDLLDVTVLDEGTEWFDTGTEESLRVAANHVHEWQTENRRLLGSPEAAAFHAGFINADQLLELGRAREKSPYGKLLIELATNGR